MAKINRIVIPLYPDFDILDVCGPLAMFSSVAGATSITPVLAAAEPGLMKSLQGVELQADLALPTLSGTDATWVPGGFGSGFNEQISASSETLAWLKREGPKAGYICSVCTGAILLAAAGLLDGYTATTHWQFQQSLTLFSGVRLASGYPRYWIDRNRITGGGISSGLDASLAVIAAISSSTDAMHAQLLNQYAPDPPYNAGSPLTAPPDILASFFQQFGEGAATLEQVVAAYLSGGRNQA
ncbi:DJ-1/PfpI family protein [Luteolibacter ambystomatis]|uniref:DJ-1/PfpI family protein n=1 Tax=Luteolibacter ambystomatis TaxID=2824561 RepID=A0A975J130_9BACT|nr:DJ-1/PfpI family protein [Luteolibacter ambystomatis]QUE52083.1 DJ-1/PfpI family protein [Luteolibacter ambystomatis]